MSVKAGQVAGERVHIDVEVEDSQHPVTLKVSSPGGIHITDAPLTWREAHRLRDTLQDAIELVGKVGATHSRALPAGLKVGGDHPAPRHGPAGRPKL